MRQPQPAYLYCFRGIDNATLMWQMSNQLHKEFSNEKARLKPADVLSGAILEV
jgi:hypothetical protein